MEKMKKYYKLFLSLVVLVSLLGCQSVKEGLSKNKRTNSDEFLVEKKSPLVKPPEFDELPVPESFSQKKDNTEQQDMSIKNILNKEISKQNKTVNKKKINKKLESSILEKIRNN